MLVAVLVAPETLKVAGQEYSAGQDLPLNKGQAQQLAKALAGEGVKMEFRVENRADDEDRGQQDHPEKDVLSDTSVGGSEGAPRRGKGRPRRK